MSVTDWKFPGTTAIIDLFGNTWANPDYSKADDTNYTTTSTDGKTSSDILICKNFGFSSSDIPSDATINGIEFIICKYSGSANKVGDTQVQATKDGSTLVGSNLSSASYWPTGSPSEVTYGGATNLLGTTWTQGEILATTFGLTLACAAVTFAAYVDYMKVRVYYTAGGGSLLLPKHRMRHMIIR